MSRTPLVRRVLTGVLLGLGVVIITRVLSGQPFAGLAAAFVATVAIGAILGRHMPRD